MTKDKFALVIDLRTVNDKHVFANGREILNTQDGIAIEIKKKATTKDLTCYMYVVSDAQVSVQNKNMVRVSKWEIKLSHDRQRQKHHHVSLLV